MAPFTIKASALKRADELVHLGQPMAALQSLHEILTSKRYRTYSEMHEQVAVRLLELCVEGRKGKLAREALQAYRNIAQNVSISGIENVVRRYLDLTEKKVEEAHAKAQSLAGTLVDDDDEDETPESLVLRMVSGQESKDRADRQVLTPWFKFYWESLRNVLDVLRNNNKLEALYQSVAHRGFQHCFQYKRKTELRRLCELLRSHMLGYAKYSHQTFAINLNNPESLQMHLETRFLQLNKAAQMELWQEAFRSIESIHELLLRSRKAAQPSMMATFYDYLTRIFWVEKNFLFHAASYLKQYQIAHLHLQQAGNEEELQRLSSMVVLSALAAPIITSTQNDFGSADMDSSKSRLFRLTSLLHMAEAPTRASLLQEAQSRQLLKRAYPEVRELFEMLEAQFHPLSITKKIVPVMEKLKQNQEMARYLQPLYAVILTRLLQQLSQVYTTIKFSSLLKLVSFPGEFALSKMEIEKFILNGCKRGEFNIRINHQTQTLTFDDNLFALHKTDSSDGAQLQSVPAEQMRTQLARLADRLMTVVDKIDPSIQEAFATRKQEAMVKVLAGLEAEHKAVLARKDAIERRKEEMETLLAEKERKEAKERAARERQEAEAERLRVEEESRRREMERMRRDHEEIERQQALKLAEDMKKKNVKIDVEDLETLDKTRLLQLQVEQLETEKRTLQAKLKTLGTRIDHTERAYRQEEIPLIRKSYDTQKKADREAHEQAFQQLLEATKRQFDIDTAAKKRLLRVQQDFQDFKKQLTTKHADQVAKLRQENRKKLEAAKKKRTDEYIATKKAELAQKRAAEKAQRLREEQELREAEEKEKKQAALRASLLKDKEDRERQMQEAQEQARRQLQREQEAEENRRRRDAERSGGAAATAPSSTGKYVPPARAAGGVRTETSTPELDWTSVRRKERPLTSPSSSATAAPESKPGTWRPSFRDREANGSSSTGSSTPSWRNSQQSTVAAEEGGRPSSGAFGGSGSGASGKYVPPRGASGLSGSAPPPWRRSEETTTTSKPASGSSGSSGKYVPPSRR